MKTYATLYDNSVSRDLLSRLPLTLSFDDFNNTEKIAYLPDGSEEWDKSDAPDSCDPDVGDITVYAPWGNIAVFYRDFRASSGLIPLGKLDEGGIDLFTANNGSFTVTIGVVGENTGEDKPPSEGTETPDDPETPDISENDILVVWFSYSNRTESVANEIVSQSGGDAVEIIQSIPYTAADTNYNDSNSRSQVERRTDARPEISDTTYDAIDMAEYETVIIGYPIWNGYEPMIIRTFIEHYDGLSGKDVYTFSTAASSGGSTAYGSVSGRCPNARMNGNLHFTSSTLYDAQNRVHAWLDDSGLLKKA